MKAEAIDPRQQIIDQVKENKSFKFVGLYKTAAETLNGFGTGGRTHESNAVPETTSKKQKHSRNRHDDNKRKKGTETVEFADTAKVHTNSSITDESPSSKKKNNKSDSTIKSIMKNKTNDMTLNEPNVSLVKSKPKKRSKSVSFVLEVTAKKSKSNEEKSSNKKHNKDKSHKEVQDCNEEENWATDKNQTVTDTIGSTKKEKIKEHITTNTGEPVEENSEEKSLKKKKMKRLVITNSNMSFKTRSLNKEKVKEHVSSNTKESGNEKSMVKLDSQNKVNENILKNSEESAEENRKVKKAKKFRPSSPENVTTEDAIDNETTQNKKKKNKKKRKAKSSQDNTESDEPAVKAPKKELKPEIIVQDLQNLNIGDNPNTLSNLLDEMTVVDKKKKKSHRQKHKKNKRESDSNTTQDDALKETRENTVWKNRKWNKDRKNTYAETIPKCAVVVDNLPLKVMWSYKRLLADHFNKFGTITGIGVAEAFPNDDPKPVFTSTIYFTEPEAATKALQEDNTLFQGNRIRVRLPHPPKDTTVVIRAYAEITDQALSSIFSCVGRIRSIRHSVKGKNSIATAFIVFDRPESVELALNLALDTKINGKKMYAARFENRSHSKRSLLNDESTEYDYDDN